LPRCTAPGRGTANDIAIFDRKFTRYGYVKVSTDRKCAAKVEDVVALYVDPSAHAIVLSIHEKSHIRTLDWTQPGLPMKMATPG
jgi:hypothetical protein